MRRLHVVATVRPISRQEMKNGSRCPFGRAVRRERARPGTGLPSVCVRLLTGAQTIHYNNIIIVFLKTANQHLN